MKYSIKQYIWVRNSSEGALISNTTEENKEFPYAFSVKETEKQSKLQSPATLAVKHFLGNHNRCCSYNVTESQ